MRPRLAAGASTGFMTVSSCNRDNASCPKPNGLPHQFPPGGNSENWQKYQTLHISRKTQRGLHGKIPKAQINGNVFLI
jgi:hypothetical protein